MQLEFCQRSITIQPSFSEFGRSIGELLLHKCAVPFIRKQF